MPNQVPVPVPRYINSTIALKGLDQSISIGTGSGQISLDEINELIAISETDVEQDLSPYYQTPNITTGVAKNYSVLVASGTWRNMGNVLIVYGTPIISYDIAGVATLNISDTSWNYLYKLFLYRSQYNIYRQYFGITGDQKGDDLWTTALSSYNEMLTRFYRLDQTKTYVYPAFQDIAPNPSGINRQLNNSITGVIGGAFVTQLPQALANLKNPNRRGWW